MIFRSVDKIIIWLCCTFQTIIKSLSLLSFYHRSDLLKIFKTISLIIKIDLFRKNDVYLVTKISASLIRC